jgi:ubiquinone/menaquinone biosynthesis C-methylase UbiE
MDVRIAYNQWAEQYDTNQNRTRDLEGVCLRELLAGTSFNTCLEVGCGTGKNTVWLLERVRHITAVDLSEVMLEKAREKITSSKVDFIQADINTDWNFVDQAVELATFSLVLEHIEDLAAVFQKLASAVKANGYVYVGELQRLDSKQPRARRSSPASITMFPTLLRLPEQMAST